MSKNQNLHGNERSENQKNLMSDDPGDGARVTFDPEARDGEGNPGDRPQVQGQDALAEFGRRGSKQD